MEDEYFWPWYINNLWQRENSIGLKGIEGKGGYKKGRYFPYTTPNGNVDLGPGFDMDKQDDKEFVRKAYAEGFTKEELDKIATERLKSENGYFNQRIIKEGGDPASIGRDVRAGLLDMYWQLKNGIYGYDEFWKAVANKDYKKMREESATYYEPKNGKYPKDAIVKDGKILDEGRWDYRKKKYFHDPSFRTGTTSRWAEGGFLKPKDAWDTLSLKEKAEMMKVAVKNGIYDLQTIRNKYNEFAEGGEVEEEELPPMVPFKQRTEVIITPDPEYNQYLNTLPDNQRFTPNDAYDSYYYWKLSGKPKNFEEAYSKGMFHYDHSDNVYHANSVAFGDDGVGYFMKPKTHDTVGYETDWFNKGLITEEGGHQRPMTPEEKAEWLDFRSKYVLTNDPARPNFYRYEPKALGGNLFKGGGYKPSTSVKKRISTWEGTAMTGAKDPLSGKRGKNRSFEAEADSFYDALPSSIRNQVLSNPNLADNLFSYSYNVGAGNFKKRVVPALERYYNGKGSAEEIANSMWASGDKKLRGLRKRRAVERKGVVDALSPAFMPQAADNTFMFNPYITQVENTQMLPIMVPDEDSYVTTHEVSPAEQKAIKFNAETEAMADYNRLMNTISILNNSQPEYTPANSIYTIKGLGGPIVEAAINEYKNGGNIYIKPSHRGRLTELKKRTGKTEAELYRTGGPSVRKMITFARNARKWKHGLGGPLDANVNMFLTGGPKRQPTAAKPAKKNRFEDMSIEELEAIEKANEEYWRKQQEELNNRTSEQIRQMSIEADKNYRQRNPNGGEADPNLQRSAGVVMSALSDIANSTPFTGSEVAEAAEAQRQKKLDKAHELKRGLDATMTAAEFLAAGYGVTRGLTHLNRYMARQATQSTGQVISRDAMRNLAKWNRRVAQIDKPQVLMNGIGGTADAYQWYTADNNFDAWENGLETGANAAGVVGGMNWFRNLPYLRRIGGDKIDAILDGLGYGAAGWDVVKNIPPLSGALYNIRTQSKENKALGGNLFSGEENHSNQMNIFRRPNGEYFYQASPDSEEITVTPLNTMFDNPALWTYTDTNGKIYTPRQTANTNQGTIVRKEDKGPLVEAAKNYLEELQYDINNGIPIGGKYTMPAIAASALLPLAGEALAGTSIAGTPATTWADAALTAGFGAHGLNHAINEGIDGWGDAAITALEVAPLGILAKPVYEGVVQPGMRLFNSPLTGNWTKIGNREYRLSPNSLGANGSPIESRGIAPQITAENTITRAQEIQELIPRYNKFAEYYGYNTVPEGTSIQEAENLIKEGLKQHNTFYRGLTYPEGEKLEAVKKVLGENASREEIMDYLAKSGSRDPGNTYFSLDERANQYARTGDVARYTRKYTLGDSPSTWLEDADFAFDTTPATSMAPKGSINYPWAGSYTKEAPGEVRINPEDVTFEGWMPKTRWEYGEYVKPSEYKTNKNLYFNKNAGGTKPTFKTSTSSVPTITAENAASMAPEQWDAAYRAAYEAGDMEEVQRLRDLHFMAKAPETAIASGGLPIHAYHGTGKLFNEFDTTGKYSTLDEGYYGVGAYFAPNKEIADMYANTERTPIIYDTYLNIKNPLKHVRDENADLYGKPIVNNDGVISTLPDDLIDPNFDMTEFVATKPNQIKKADAITYDDAGNTIPLSQRDNFALGDMRYGLLPFGIGLTGYGLFNNQEALGGKIKKR